MSKSDFIRLLATNLAVSITEANKIFKKVNQSILEYVKDNAILRVPDFGTFQVKRTKTRKLTNPKTGQPMLVPERNVLGFKASSSVKELLNGKK